MRFLRNPGVLLALAVIACGAMNPPAGTAINPNHPLALGLVSYWPMNEGGGLRVLDAAGKNHGTLVSATRGSSARGNATVFNGSSSSFEVPAIDLSSVTVVTLSMWMYWDAYANDDDLALETSTNFNFSSSAILIDPNASSGSFFVSFKASDGYNDAVITRPSAGTWHQFTFVMDATASTTAITPYIDGALAGYTKNNSSASSVNFGNHPWYFMSRASSALFGAGKLKGVALWRRGLTPTEVRQFYTNSYAMMRQPERTYLFSPPAGGAPTPARRRVIFIGDGL